MADDIFEKRATALKEEEKYSDPFEKKALEHKVKNDPFFTRSVQLNPENHGPTVLDAVWEGLQGGSSGLLLGGKAVTPPENEPYSHHIARMISTGASDLPFNFLGGLGGAAAGSAIAGPVGGLIAGGAGAMALPEAIKQTFAEYEDFVKQGGDLTLAEFIERSANVAKETGKAGIIGAATGVVGKALPFLSKIPGFNKLLNTKPGQVAAATVLELGALTGTQAALEGELPSGQQTVDNLIQLLGFKAAGAGVGKVNEAIKGKVAEVKAPEVKPLESNQFKTEKGSIYSENKEGKTTRNKAFREEHGEKEVGPQKESENTWYGTKEDLNKLSIFETQPYKNKLVELPDGKIGVQPLEGPNKGKILATSIVNPETSPKEGLYPIESWNKGEQVHFGNKITEVGVKPEETKVEAKPGKSLREDLKKLYQEVNPNLPSIDILVEHLATSIEKGEYSDFLHPDNEHIKNAYLQNEKLLNNTKDQLSLLKTEGVNVLKKEIYAKSKEVKPKKLEVEKPKVPKQKETKVKPSDAPEKLFENAPIPENPNFLQKAKKLLLKPKSEVGDKVWKLKEEYYGKKAYKLWENRRKWNKELKSKEFSPQELSDMQFYIEKPEAFGKKASEEGTGNPFKDTKDTYEALEGRLSDKAKDTVKNIIEPHFEEWRKIINDSAYAKKINPRDFLEGVYVPHFYSGDTKAGAKQAMQTLSKKFSTNNPFANKRTLLTYNEALQKAGLTPKYDNIADTLNEYDRVMTRVLVNSDLAGQLGQVEKDIGSKLIVRSTDKNYSEAKREGWVPFDDAYLRRYVAGTNKNGEPIFATLETPALVHPEVADALQGIFIKDASKPQESWIGGKGYDVLSDKLKSLHVGLSGFHFVSLAEESAKTSGYNIIESFKRGGKLLDDPIFMKDYLESGATLHEKSDMSKQSESAVKEIENQMKLAGGNKKKVAQAARDIGNLVEKPTKFLFEEFQPRLKVAAFYDMRSRELARVAKEGRELSAAERTQMNKEIGRLVNDQFGGQAFELLRNPTTLKAFDLNDPKVLKQWRRYGGYVDWSISAAREFGKTVKGLKASKRILLGQESTVTERQALRNAGKYAFNLFMSQQIMSYLFSGFYNKEDGSVGWDINKSHSTFENDDPSKWWSFQLPDVEVNILGKKRNFGRDDKGRKLYSHFGKKLFEIFHYGSDPVGALFNKSNPVAQLAIVQALGGTPSLEHGVFPAQGVYKEGKFVPWEGKKGFAQAGPRSYELFKSMFPFSVQRFFDEGWAALLPYVPTLGGSVPIDKGMSLYKAESYIDKAIRNKDVKALNQIRRLLKDNGYNETQIKRTVSKIQNRIKKEND